MVEQILYRKKDRENEVGRQVRIYGPFRVKSVTMGRHT